MQPSEAIMQAESAYRAGDYGPCVRILHRLFVDDITFFEAEAARYVASVPASDRSQFWSPPKDFYPDREKIESIFDFIYARGVWGGGSGCGSASGPASPRRRSRPCAKGSLRCAPRRRREPGS